MRDLSSLVSEDSRKPIERLRRAQLWKVAEAMGITYPVGAPKTTMISLLEANGVDLTRPIDGIQWRVTNGTDSEGRPHQELYPVVPEHASARKNVNANAVLSQKLAAQQKAEEKKEQTFQNTRLEALERDNKLLQEENQRLRDVIDQRLAALEQKQPEQSESRGPNASQREYWKAYRQAKDMGLPVKRGMTRDEIEALIKGADENTT